MAGSSKKKSKKKKGKSNRNKPSTVNKEHCDSSDVPKESDQNKNLPPSLSPNEDGDESKYYNESMLEQELYRKVENLYVKALEKMAVLNYIVEDALTAILINGSIFGESNIVDNIVTNAIAVINSARMIRGEIVFDREPIFKNMDELMKYSMQLLMSMILKDRPDLQKSDAILHLLSSDALLTDGNCSHPKDENVDVEKLLKETTASLKKLDINNVPSISSTSVSPFVDSITVSADSLSSHESLEMPLDFKTLVGCPDGMDFEEWLKSGSDEQKDESISILVEEKRKLEAQVMERKEWALKTVVQANEKFNHDHQELMMLRSEKMGGFEKENESLRKENELLADYNSKLLEKENNLRRVHFVHHDLIDLATRLGAQNQEIRANVAAFELHASESDEAKKQAQKGEKKALKRTSATEKQVSEIKRQIEDEKQKIVGVKQKLVVVNEANEQAKVKLQQEIEAKEHARAILLEEKRLYTKAKEESKERLEALKRELDMDRKRQSDHMESLRLELSQLKQAQDASSSSNASDTESSTRRNELSRKCLICSEKEVSILFLPCAHEVICSACHDEVYDVFQNLCPICNVRVEKRIKAYAPS